MADVYEAYELLTGKPLPKAPGAKEVRPELPPRHSNGFEPRRRNGTLATGNWTSSTMPCRPPLDKKASNSMMNEAAEHGKKSDDYYKQGMANAGYSQALSATLKASVAFQAAKVVKLRQR